MLIKLTSYFEDTTFYLESSLIQRLEDCSNESKLTKVITLQGEYVVLGDIDFLARMVNGEGEMGHPFVPQTDAP